MIGFNDYKAESYLPECLDTMREQRAYIHQTCKSQTEVSGPEFQAMSDPLAGMQTTYCSQCEDQFPVDEFAWSDTSESISSYYARYRKNATPSDLWWCGNGGLALMAIAGLILGVTLGIIIGVVSTVTLGLIAGVVLAILGAIVGVVIRESLITKRITQRVCGVEDTRELR